MNIHLKFITSWAMMSMYYPSRYLESLNKAMNKSLVNIQGDLTEVHT
jgi:TorA maturation chaperone TorD